MTDREATDELGVALQTVMLRRNALNIEAQTPKPRHQWTEAQVKKLGTVRDSVLTSEIGVSLNVIGNKRNQNAIERFAA